LNQTLQHTKISARERNYLLLAGIFITSLTLGNVVGVTKFVDLGRFLGVIPAGLFAYPITFLATDLISELYGRSRAQAVVWVGFFMNFLILFLMWAGHVFPDASGVSGAAATFESLYDFMKPNVVASIHLPGHSSFQCSIRFLNFYPMSFKLKFLGKTYFC
jgi:uncharacterized integral membrane protein (TIGR00697 family)